MKYLVILMLALGVIQADAASGKASYYWHGKHVACGGKFNPHGMTVAHKTLPCGTILRVSRGGRSVIVRVNDRGPFIRGRVLDLSLGAAKAIGLTGVGVGYVDYHRVD